MESLLETDCTIEHNGKEYTAGGSYLLPCTDGRYRGVVYIKQDGGSTINPKHTWGTVTTWHGEQLARAGFTDYHGNFCQMRRVSFTWQGMKFIGDYCPDWSEACKVRTTKMRMGYGQ